MWHQESDPHRNRRSNTALCDQKSCYSELRILTSSCHVAPKFWFALKFGGQTQVVAWLFTAGFSFSLQSKPIKVFIRFQSRKSYQTVKNAIWQSVKLYQKLSKCSYGIIVTKAIKRVHMKWFYADVSNICFLILGSYPLYAWSDPIRWIPMQLIHAWQNVPNKKTGGYRRFRQPIHSYIVSGYRHYRRPIHSYIVSGYCRFRRPIHLDIVSGYRYFRRLEPARSYHTLEHSSICSIPYVMGGGWDLCSQMSLVNAFAVTAPADGR